jgi:hypothetical protein
MKLVETHVFDRTRPDVVDEINGRGFDKETDRRAN